MDLFQRHHRVSVDSFVNPVEAQLNYAKSLSSTPSEVAASVQPTETNFSLSVDGHIVESEGSGRPILTDEAAFEVQTMKVDKPFDEALSSKKKEKCDAHKDEEKENNSSLKFLVTDTAQYLEDFFGSENMESCTKANLSKFLWKKEENDRKKSVPVIDNKTCNARGYKSLSLLCENFIKLYGNHSNEEFFVDEVAEILHVERRRIYDIVNVLESLGIVVKKKRNHYKWQGVDRIPFTLIALKVSSEVENDVKQQNTSTMEAVESLTCSSDECSLSSQKNDDAERESGLLRHRSDQNDKFLGVLTQRFIKLFLESSESIISFQEITRLLLGEQDKDMKSKTGIRRLYDIANILSALQLIQKTQKWNGEMAYEWLLSEITYLQIFSSTKLYEEKSNFSRKRDLSLFRQYKREEEEKSKLTRTNEADGDFYNINKNAFATKKQEIAAFNEEKKEENSRGQVDSKVNKRDGNCNDWYANATQQVQDLDSSGQFANVYVPNFIPGSDALSVDDSTVQLQKSFFEFQQNVVRQWHQWFEQVPATAKIGNDEASFHVETSHETSGIAPSNFLPLPFYWSIRPFPQVSMDDSTIYEATSTASTRNEDVVKADEGTRQ
ncbi:E2F transcription factor-like E2FE [Galdieria sulphuraria]|nr:E2F transcription factor-like E2FE [Galdieria sulphuraria]